MVLLVQQQLVRFQSLPHLSIPGRGTFCIANSLSTVSGRCEMAAGLTAEELGSSFAIQSYGDLAARRAAGL